MTKECAGTHLLSMQMGRSHSLFPSLEADVGLF